MRTMLGYRVKTQESCKPFSSHRTIAYALNTLCTVPSRMLLQGGGTNLKAKYRSCSVKFITENSNSLFSCITPGSLPCYMIRKLSRWSYLRIVKHHCLRSVGSIWYQKFGSNSEVRHQAVGYFLKRRKWIWMPQGRRVVLSVPRERLLHHTLFFDSDNSCKWQIYDMIKWYEIFNQRTVTCRSSWTSGLRSMRYLKITVGDNKYGRVQQSKAFWHSKSFIYVVYHPITLQTVFHYFLTSSSLLSR